MTKKLPTARAPRNVITCVCEAWPEAHPNMKHGDTLAFTCGAWSIMHTRRTKHGAIHTRDDQGATIEHLWQSLKACMPEKGSTWLLVPDLSEWLVLSEAYYRILAQELWIPGSTSPPLSPDTIGEPAPKHRHGYLAIGGAAEIFSGRLRSWPIEIVAVGNYHPGSVCELLSTIADDETCRASIHTEAGRYVGRSREACMALHRWITERMRAWSEDVMSGWRHTASQLSHSAGRKVYGQKVIHPTDRPEVRMMERDACYGGRAEVFDTRTHVAKLAAFNAAPARVRDGQRPVTPSPLFRYDIRSCYPFIIGNYPAPKMLIGAEYGLIDPSRVQDDDRIIQIAFCRVKTVEPLYPCRVHHDCRPVHSREQGFPTPLDQHRRHRTIFPTGEFWTTLCGEELRRAAAAGHITAMYNLCSYGTTCDIQPYMRSLWNRRLNASVAGDHAAESMWKMLANSYLGKFAAMNGRWEMSNEIGATEPFGEWLEVDHDAGTWIKYRSIGYIVQRQVEKKDNPSSHPIMWAWATAQARVMLWDHMKLAGLENVIQCDTDGFYVNRAGRDQLDACGFTAESPDWGELRFVSVHAAARFWGPKHYWDDVGSWTMSGIPDGFTMEDDSPASAYQSQYFPPSQTDCEGLVGRVRKLSCFPSLCTGRVESEDSPGRTVPHQVSAPPEIAAAAAS